MNNLLNHITKRLLLHCARRQCLRGGSRLTPMRMLLVVITGCLMAACASVGRPQGGKKDEVPPKFVSSNPGPNATGVDRQRIEIVFDENVQLQDAFNKVIVSPVQKTNPQVSSNGRRVSVELKDTLQPNTTYTIDFGDAIKDLNEGNLLDGFTTAFSTGETIDTLRVSGIVLSARELEPAQSILVGIHSDLSDTAIYTKPFDRVARTNQYGQFTVYNLKPGQYRVYALNDINRDYKWDRTEDVAFYDLEVSPWTEPIEVVDTLRSSTNTDSLVTRPGVAYLPNDVLLTWFNEDYKSLYLKDYKRPERNQVYIEMSAPVDTFPRITIASGPMQGRNIDEWALLDNSPKRDSLLYWIRDTTVLAMDSLLLSVNYLRTDTTDELTWKADTLKFFWKEPKKKEKKKKKDEEADTLPPPPTFIDFKAVTSTKQELNLPLIFANTTPIDTILPEGVHLEIKEDTVWYPIDDVRFVPDSLKRFTQVVMNVDWEEGEKYRLLVDSASVIDIYGNSNKPVKHEFTAKTPEDYTKITFKIIGTDLPTVVEILDKGDKPIAIAHSDPDGSVTFPYLKPGTVYARLFIDKNGNGKWDTGNMRDTVQPEEVYYYPKKLNLKQNWDVTQDWNLYETPVDMQKPYDIKKNKPKLKKGEKKPVDEDEEEEDTDFGFGNFGTSGMNGRNRNQF